MSQFNEPNVPISEPGTAGVERAAFVARLRLILRQWPSADRLARAMGVSPSAFRKWLKGEAEPSRERLVALANAAHVGIGWLATGEGPEPAFAESDAISKRYDDEAGLPSRFVLLPHRPTAAAAGPPIPSEQPWLDGEYMALRQDWVRNVVGLNPDKIGLEVAVGDSMMPTINHGDLMLLDTSDKTFAHFGVYVLQIGTERLVKRIQRKLDGSLTLISDNPNYERDYLPAEKAAVTTVVGRVVWSGGLI
jgi:phage repressor protein C with HTH and peptisase S24 domain